MLRIVVTTMLLGSLLMIVGISRGASVDIRGPITSISAPRIAAGAGQNFVGTIMIEGKKEPDTNVDKASVRVTPKTRIFREENGKRIEATFADLQVGQRVTAQFTGPVAESYPVQATAGEIVILSQNTHTAAPSQKADTADQQVRPPMVLGDKLLRFPLDQVPEGTEVSVNGTLKGGMMAIGGETTGWILHYQRPEGARTIEVDLSGLHGESMQGPVRVTGKIIRREYVERGSVLILRATKIEKVAETPNAPPAPPQLSPGVNQPVTVQRALEVQNRHTDELMKIPGVVGVGTGIGKLAPIVIKVMVTDAASARNPQIPKQLEGVSVEVEVTGVIRAF
jgi:hypothetical protein